MTLRADTIRERLALVRTNLAVLGAALTTDLFLPFPGMTFLQPPTRVER